MAYLHQWYLDHREYRIAKAAEWRRAHPKETQAYFKAYRPAHKETINANNRKYRKAHPGIGNDDRQYRRVLKLQVGAERIRMKELRRRDNNTCQICHTFVGVQGASIDHIVPISFGGSHTWANVQLAHTTCNAARGAGRTPAQMRLAV